MGKAVVEVWANSRVAARDPESKVTYPKLDTFFWRNLLMLHIPISRWGEPYKSLELDKVVHFATGEVLADVSRANGGLVERDMRHAARARKVLQEIPIKKLLEIVKKAGEL